MRTQITQLNWQSLRVAEALPKLYREVCAVLCALLLPVLMFGQDAVADLEKINTTYGNATSWTMDMQANLVVSGSSEVIDSYEGTSKRDGNNYYSSFMGREVMVNDHCTIIADANQEVVMYDDKTVPELFQSTLETDQLLELLKTYESVEYSKQTEAYSELVITLKEDHAYYEYIVVGYNTNTGILSKLIFQLQDDDSEMPYNRIEMTYTNVVLDGDIEGSWFSEKRYVKKSGGQLVTVGDYENYHLIQTPDE